MIVNNNIELLRMIFLRCMAGVYCIAFTSLYFQLPGLYSYDGITPMHIMMDGIREQVKIDNNFTLSLILPSIFWFSDVVNPYILKILPNLSEFHEVDNMLHFVILFASVLSFLMTTGFIKSLINPISFLILWCCYYSIFILGGIFMMFQWDKLLLEVGFLTILFAPITPSSKPGVVTKLIRELIRWLMFRLMFGSGIAKLLSNCPTWWGLTALNYHFESQPLPNGISWYAHHLPDAIKKFGVLDMFIVELLLPILFYAPLRSLRIFSGIRQNIFMISIMMTGNYNFFNILAMVINLVNFDDEFILYVTPHWLLKLLRFDLPEIKEPDKVSRNRQIFGTIIPVVTIIGVTIYIYSLFNFGNVNEQRAIERLFTYSELTTFLENSEYPFYFIAYVGFFILSNYAIECSETLNKIAESFSFIFTITNIIYSSIITLIFVYFFIGTISVFGISPQLSKYGEYQKSYLQTYCIVNSYGLLREMTGINGRDELIIYGSIDRENWKPYEFYHKPTKTKRMPTFVVPYQPRLDWQMCLSAASASPSFTTNDLYLNSLIHKLLQNSPSVLQFIKENPFENEPPQYIKINKLTYHFSPITELSDGSWIPEKWWNVESKRVVYIKPVQLSDFGLKLGKPIYYPLHPMQDIKLLLIYTSFWACLLAFDGIKMFVFNLKRIREQQEEDVKSDASSLNQKSTKRSKDNS